MRGMVGGIAAAMLAMAVGHAADAPAPTRDPSPMPHALYFAGGDAWHAGVFAHAGFVWSPAGLFREGFTAKLLAAGGTWRYRAGADGGFDVRGLMALDAILVGWRFKGARMEATVLAGLDVQTHWLFPYDPGNRLRGTHAGLRGEVDIWYQPSPQMMLALSGSASSIGPNYFARAAAGWRLADAIWLGPEISALGGPTHAQGRAGLHATAFRTGALEWSAGAGLVADSDSGPGAYGRFGVLIRR